MRFWGVMGLGALLLAVPPKAGQVESKRRELQQIQKELEAARREIEEYARLGQSLGRELQRLEGKNTEARRRLGELQRNIRQVEARRLELRLRLAALGQASGFWGEALDWELRRYALWRLSRAEAASSSDLWSEAFQSSAILEKAQLLKGLKGLGQRTAQAELEARRKAQDWLQKSQRVEAEQRSRLEEYQQKKAQAARTREKAAAAKARAKELEESALALTRLIKLLSRQSAYQRPGGARLEAPVHSLPWPAAGAVVQAFGRQRHAELGTWVIHQGIRLATQPGAPVAAVEEGRVIFSGPFRSYGQLVILDHGSSFFSIYGELGEILRPKGSEVRSGEIIGRAGVRLYLEFRRGTQALDPVEWLRMRGNDSPPRGGGE